MKRHHNVQELNFARDNLQIKVDGETYTFQLSKISEKLSKASKIERERYEISASGYGIHWPLIDEDLSIDGLLGVVHSPSSQRKAS
jgi:acid stress-induced BolA-like protein IbaG/YrbA